MNKAQTSRRRSVNKLSEYGAVFAWEAGESWRLEGF